MANFLELAIEKMIQDGIVTESELNQRIQEEREKSPITKIGSDTDSVGQLISFLIQHDESMSQVVNLLLTRLMMLEKKVKELEQNG